MEYRVRLMDSKKFSEEQRPAIEGRYSEALRQHLGGADEVASAYRAWVAARTRQDEAADGLISLPEQQAILRWENAETAARLLAFEGYTGSLEDLYIEVKACADSVTPRASSLTPAVPR
jgi:hypothetical protein